MENRWTNKEKELAELLKQIGVIELYHWYKDTYWYTESDTGKLPRKSFPSLNHDERIDINEIVVGDDMIQGCIKSDYIIAECPTIDVVEVVRCKDCAWVTLNAESNRYWCSYYLGALEVKATNFCGLAKRKNDYGSDAERREP